MSQPAARIGVYDNFAFPPYTFECAKRALNRTAGCHRPGLDADIIEYLFKRMGRPYVLVNCGSVFGAVLEDGTLTHCMEWLGDGRIDTFAATFISRAARRRHFTYSMPLHTFGYSAVVPIHLERTVMDTLTQLLMPFSMQLWLVFLLAFVAVVVCKKLVGRWRSASTSESDRARSVALRQLATSWAITSMLCMAMYRSFLLSSMMMRTAHDIPIADYASLVNALQSNEVRLHLHELSSVVGDMIETQTNMDELREALVDNPIMVEQDYSYVERTDGVSIQVDTISRHLIRGMCNVHTFPIDFETEQALTMSLIFNANVSWIADINRAIQEETSAMARIVNLYTADNRGELCSRSASKTTPTYMTIETLVSAFLFLGVGGLFSACVLAMERFSPTP